MTPTIPIATVSAMGTIEAAKQKCDNKHDPSYPLYSQPLSPNGDWIAAICDPQNTGETITKIIKSDSSKEWTVSFAETYGKDLDERYYHGGRLLAYLAPYKWSDDGQYLYLGAHLELFGDGPNLSSTADGLLRINLSNGNVEDLITYSVGGFEFQVSPNEKYLAYTWNNIHLVDLKSKKETQISIPDKHFDLGFLAWSPDSKKLVFTTVKEEQWYEQDEGFTLYLYDFESRSLKKLIEDDMNFLSEHKWISNTVFESENFFENNHFQYDIETDTLTPLENP